MVSNVAIRNRRRNGSWRKNPPERPPLAGRGRSAPAWGFIAGSTGIMFLLATGGRFDSADLRLALFGGLTGFVVGLGLFALLWWRSSRT